MSRILAVVSLLVFASCTKARPVPDTRMECRVVGAFRYASNVAHGTTKVITDRGEYIVHGDVSGEWNSPVERCQYFAWDVIDGWPEEGLDTIRLGVRWWLVQ